MMLKKNSHTFDEYFRPRSDEESYKDYIKREVEGLLLTEDINFQPKGTYTTDPHKERPMWVGRKDLEGSCPNFSRDLEVLLYENNIATKSVSVDIEGEIRLTHEYRVANNGVEDIIIESTIGQFLVGHNHVFVGTREELRDIFVNQTEGNPYYLRFSISQQPEEVFGLLYGNSS